ncbi:MAG TPA: hypothetical protein VFI59_04980 [Actinomycetota bacterium]|nr:hypothetical protein [Actinomycetota bacterium]
MRTARASIRSAALLAGLTLLLAGCLKLDMALTISPDDTVDGEMVFAVNKELLELTGQNVDDLLGDTAVPDDVPGATQEPYEDDRFVGTRVLFEDVALQDIQEGSGPDALSIERTGDTYEVNGVMDLTTDSAELQGNPFEDQISEAFDTAELRIAITFPGEVLETNGQVDGTTVTWEPVFGERTELRAVASASGDVAGGDEPGQGASGEQAGATEEGGFGANAWLYAILGLVIVGAVVGLFVMMRRHRADAGPAPGAPEDVVTAPLPSTAPAPPATPAPPPPPPAPAESSSDGPGDEPAR